MSKKNPIVITLLCDNGETGKTTTAIGLADALVAGSPASKVLIIDCDQENDVTAFLASKRLENEGGVASCLLDGVSPNKMKISVRPQIDVLPSGGLYLLRFERTMLDQPDAEILMRKYFSGLTGYDYILIDTRPATELISANAVLYADYILIPCSSSLPALNGVRRTLAFLQDLREHFEAKYEHFPQVLGIVPTIHNKRRQRDLDVLSNLKVAQKSGLLFGGVVFEQIAEDEMVEIGREKRMMLSEFAPYCEAATGYRALAKSILEMTSKQPTITINPLGRGRDDKDGCMGLPARGVGDVVTPDTSLEPPF